MHQKRNEASTRLPIRRKGTKYVARANNFVNNSVPIVIAVRDMLNLAKNAKEVQYMVTNKLIKINGREANDIKQSVKLFNTLEVGKKYKLTILPTGKFTFEETKDSTRLCRVTGKKMLKNKQIQLNLHDSTNVMTKEKVKVGDSVELDAENKIKKVIPIEKGKEVFIFSGRSAGLSGKIKNIEGKDITVAFKELDKEVVLHMSHAIVL